MAPPASANMISSLISSEAQDLWAPQALTSAEETTTPWGSTASEVLLGGQALVGRVLATPAELQLMILANLGPDTLYHLRVAHRSINELYKSHPGFFKNSFNRQYRVLLDLLPEDLPAHYPRAFVKCAGISKRYQTYCVLESLHEQATAIVAFLGRTPWPSGSATIRPPYADLYGGVAVLLTLMHRPGNVDVFSYPVYAAKRAQKLPAHSRQVALRFLHHYVEAVAHQRLRENRYLRKKIGRAGAVDQKALTRLFLAGNNLAHVTMLPSALERLCAVFDAAKWRETERPSLDENARILVCDADKFADDLHVVNFPIPMVGIGDDVLDEDAVLHQLTAIWLYQALDIGEPYYHALKWYGNGIVLATPNRQVGGQHWAQWAKEKPLCLEGLFGEMSV